MNDVAIFAAGCFWGVRRFAYETNQGFSHRSGFEINSNLGLLFSCLVGGRYNG